MTTNHELSDSLIMWIRGMVEEARTQEASADEVCEEVRYQFETQAEDED